MGHSLATKAVAFANVKKTKGILTSFHFACAHDNRHICVNLLRQNIQRQFVFGVFCPSRALMGASPSRISLSKIAFRDPKFEFFARRRPTMVGGAGGAFGALPNLQFSPLYTNFFSSRAPRATISTISKTAVKCLHFTAHIVPQAPLRLALEPLTPSTRRRLWASWGTEPQTHWI